MPITSVKTYENRLENDEFLKRRRQNLISVKPKDESYPQKYMIYANALVPMRNRRIKRKDFLHTFYVSQGDFYEKKYFVHLPLPLLP